MHKYNFPFFSMIPLINLVQPAEMPRCRYEVLDKDNKPIRTIAVGQKLHHKWFCNTSTPEFWCMTVQNCFVDDGAGTPPISVIDKDGYGG